MPDDTRRADGSLKGPGYFGALRRPDRRVSSELSIGVDLGSGEVQIPTLVPTLTPTEVQLLLSQAEGQAIPRAIVEKAVAFARGRMAAGLSPFAEAADARAPRLGPPLTLGQFVRQRLRR